MSILICCMCMKKCIYKIENDKNDMIYVGSTMYLPKRIEYHLNDLKCQKHCNYKLQRDYNKGFVFKFVILELVEKNKDLLKREQYYIDTLKPKYNIMKLACTTQVYNKLKKDKYKRNKQLNKIAEMNVKLYY